MGVGGRDHRSRPHPLIEEVASWVQGKAAKSGSHSDCERPTNATSMFTPAEAKGRQVSPRRKVRAQSQCQRRDVRHGMERRCFFACERRAPSSTNESTRRLNFFVPFWNSVLSHEMGLMPSPTLEKQHPRCSVLLTSAAGARGPEYFYMIMLMGHASAVASRPRPRAPRSHA